MAANPPPPLHASFAACAAYLPAQERQAACYLAPVRFQLPCSAEAALCHHIKRRERFRIAGLSEQIEENFRRGGNLGREPARLCACKICSGGQPAGLSASGQPGGIGSPPHTTSI